MSGTLDEAVARNQARTKKELAREADVEARRQADVVGRKSIAGTETFGLIRARAVSLMSLAHETAKNTQASESAIRVAQGRIGALEDLLSFFEGAAQEWVADQRTTG